MGEFNRPVNAREAFYFAASKAEQTDYYAKLRWNRPPYYMQFLKSWTTNRREEEDDTYREEGTYGQD